MSNLSIHHNSGFFSCSSIALRELIGFYNANKILPSVFDRENQYLHFKTNDSLDMSKIYFKEISSIEIPYEKEIKITSEDREDQFSDYGKLNFSDIAPFVIKYFSPSDFIEGRINIFLEQYNIVYNNTCGVFYRGNDKAIETMIAPYNSFISKAQEIHEANPNIKFLVQTDETEFLDEFLKKFPTNTVYIKEIDRMNKSGGCVSFQIQKDKKAQHGIDYLSSVLMLSRCNHLITHSGNGGFWCTLYRGNSNRVYQILNNEWL